MGLSKADLLFLRRDNIHKVRCVLCMAESLDRYIYGVLRHSRTWAELCIDCHIQHGIGIGTNRGHIHTWSKDTNTYSKIELARYMTVDEVESFNAA